MESLRHFFILKKEGAVGRGGGETILQFRLK